MILEEETFKIFGYYPSDLKPQSSKRILVKCDRCEKIREVRRQSYSDLCMSCVQKWRKLEPKGTYPIEEGMLEHETFEKFGFYPSQLKPKSGKRILVKCVECDKIREIPKQNYRAQCMSCARARVNCSEEMRKKKSIMQTGRTHSKETRKKMGIAHKGERHWNWKGGISYEPYCSKFNNQFKEYIRDKFGRICFICGKTEEEIGRKLDVHHTNYDKDCMCNDNITCQFVPLCRGCNTKVNFNRELWEAKINAKIKNQLTGWYI